MHWCRVVAVLSVIALLVSPAQAQESPRDRALPPLYLQADQLIYDTRGNRVIAQGNVEIYYNNYILTADQVIYDEAPNTLVAKGSAQLKDPTAALRAPIASRRPPISATPSCSR